MDNKNKLVLVTGASKGLGFEIARFLVEKGYDIIIHYHSNEEKIEQLKKECEKYGVSIYKYKCDFSSEKDIEQFWESLIKDSCIPDILINNARMDPYARPANFTEGQWWDLIHGVNLKAAYLLTLKCFNSMKKKGWGRVVNISSTHAFKPSPLTMISYGSSKAAMQALTRSFAAAGAEFGITVNTLAPGLIITESIDKRIDKDTQKRLADNVPLKRGATVTEIAEACAFLLTASYITGETLNINGGVYMP